MVAVGNCVLHGTVARVQQGLSGCPQAIMFEHPNRRCGDDQYVGVRVNIGLHLHDELRVPTCCLKHYTTCVVHTGGTHINVLSIT